MTTLYDDEQNPIEGALTPEEAKSLQEQAAKADDLQKAVEEKEAELEKLKSKEMNFSRLRDKSEEEKAKIMEKATEKEKLVLEELNDLRKEREDEKKVRFEATKASVLEQLAGDDETLKKNIELRAKEWGEPRTPEELQKRYTDAATLIKNARPDVQPLNSWAPVGSYNTPTRPKNFVETASGKGLYTRMFPDSPIAKEQK